jgi:hypothetical protein
LNLKRYFRGKGTYLFKNWPSIWKLSDFDASIFAINAESIRAASGEDLALRFLMA